MTNNSSSKIGVSRSAATTLLTSLISYVSVMLPGNAWYENILVVASPFISLIIMGKIYDYNIQATIKRAKSKLKSRLEEKAIPEDRKQEILQRLQEWEDREDDLEVKRFELLTAKESSLQESFEDLDPSE